LSDDTPVDGLVTLQERMVNLINQLSMPLVEVALVLQKHIAALMTTLQDILTQPNKVPVNMYFYRGRSMWKQLNPTQIFPLKK
jgi:hypothetical protein